MLTIMIPSIIAIKYRTKKGVFMAGTIIGSVTCLMYVAALIILGSVEFLKLSHHDINVVRYVKTSFLIIANIFFLEKAVRDYKEI